MDAQARKNNSQFSFLNTTKGKLPRLPFVQIKDAILGKEYELSFVFIGDARSRALNRQYRNKDKPTNVLSFSLSENEGEIFINPNKVKIEAPQFGESYSNFVGFLFIHGLLHLKGYEHGGRMEVAEKKFRKKFNI